MMTFTRLSKSGNTKYPRTTLCISILRDMSEEDMTEVKFVTGKDNPVDCLTKPLSSQKYQPLIEIMDGKGVEYLGSNLDPLASKRHVTVSVVGHTRANSHQRSNRNGGDIPKVRFSKPLATSLQYKDHDHSSCGKVGHRELHRPELNRPMHRTRSLPTRISMCCRCYNGLVRANSWTVFQWSLRFIVAEQDHISTAQT